MVKPSETAHSSVSERAKQIKTVQARLAEGGLGKPTIDSINFLSHQYLRGYSIGDYYFAVPYLPEMR